MVPLLLHFDVNKTVIQSDSIQSKTIEEGIREGISELFWGAVSTSGGEPVWQWAKGKPGCVPPVDEAGELVSYAAFCKDAVKDKSKRKAALKSFSHVRDPETKEEMEKLVQLTLKRMQLPQDVRYTKEAEAAGITTPTLNMFPTLFHLVAALQRTTRPFAILFRSFGADHEKIQNEWNAFCELRHPVYSRLIEGIGPLDGSVPHIPDRRILGLHTLYRDEKGPILILDKFTNGPPEKSWDSWARAKPKSDNRGGREYIKNVLKAKTIEGIPHIQKWMSDHLAGQRTAAIKDDWAWWQFNGEQAHAGKLLTVIPGKAATSQLFFDDNIEHSDARIVDCRDVNGSIIPSSRSMGKLCVKVNPVEALLDDEYFLRKLQFCQGAQLDVGASFIGLQKQLTEVEEEKTQLQKQLAKVNRQLKNLTEENRRMKLQRRIQIRSESELRAILSKDMDITMFETDNCKSISDLCAELEAQLCWLEHDENGHVVRVLDMVFFKLVFKDSILIETREHDSASRVTNRNYLPGVRTTLRETCTQQAVDRWLETGLQVNLKKSIIVDMLPVSVPGAPNQETGATKMYPITCRVQQSQATFVIPEREADVHHDLLKEIGLPGFKHFTTVETDPTGETITRYWRWDKKKAWEATAAPVAKGPGNNAPVNVADVIERLFRDHPRSEEYKYLLLKMFEIFEAQKLCGGFSGSVVVRVQPFEQDGRAGEPCIVKLDAGGPIREEFQNSVKVNQALPDKAARILGEAVYTTNAKNEEFGAMKLELAGACWNVPELAQGSANLLSTFKDLLLYESDQVILGRGASANEDPPFGNVNSVVAETFGPGGIVSSLRRGGDGLHRSNKSLLWGWYSLKGKEKSLHNPYTAKGSYPPEQAMRRLYKQYFGCDMPDVREIVVNTIKKDLEQLSQQVGSDFYPLVALAHGDLNAANIMIDALDAVWLIDFATSIELPLFTDMCKFEMACLFEYSTIPITPKILLEFTSSQEEHWTSMNVGDWLRVDQDVAKLLLRRLTELPQDTVATINQNDLDKLIQDVVSNCGKAAYKFPKIVRALKARLTADETMMDNAFSYCASISNALLHGEHVGQTLEIKKVPVPEGLGSRGSASLRFFAELCISVRRFMAKDIMGCLRDQAKLPEGLQIADVLSLQMWLPFLRESYRIIGYRDISPQHKIWSIYHCEVVAKHVQNILVTIRNNLKNLKSLGVIKEVQHDLDVSESDAGADKVHDASKRVEGFTEADSQWILAHANMFPMSETSDKLIRQAHKTCPVYAKEPGFFAPVWQVLTSEDVPCLLEFAPGDSKQWELFLDPSNGDVTFGSILTPQTSIGSVSQHGGRKDAPSVQLKSRLIPLTTQLMMRKCVEIDDNQQAGNASLGSVSISSWCNGISGSAKNGNGVQELDHKGVRYNQEDITKFLTLDAVACDSNGKCRAKFSLVIGSPSCCYPLGTKLCIDLTLESRATLTKPEVVIMHNDDPARYKIRDAAHPDPESEGNFNPVAANHVFMAQCRYVEGQRVLCKDSQGSWCDAEVLEAASHETGYRYRLKPSASKEGESRPKELLVNLNGMNSGIARLSVSAYDEEVHKVKAYLKARHSSIIDNLAGARLPVKQCAYPTLAVQTDDFLASAPLVDRCSTGTSRPSRGRACSKTFSITSAGSGGNDANLSGIESRTGWGMLVNAVDTFAEAIPSCSPNAFLVLGGPGSGKSCLICRLIMESLDRHVNLVPILLKVQELVKRSSQDSIDQSNLTPTVVNQWFDKHLRVSFGEDSSKYNMICQAMRMHRVFFLFEGLEEAGTMAPMLEACVKQLVTDRHLVVVTSRPLLSGMSSLEEMTEFITPMKLQNLNDEQKRLIAHNRLGLEGVEMYDALFAKLRENQGSAEEAGDTDGGVQGQGGHEDVFGNPMMLSMLICYLQMRQKELVKEQDQDQNAEADGKEGAHTGGDDNHVTLTAVYRVSIDVMLQRVQSRTQAERHKKEEKVEMCKRILEHMAMHMQKRRKQDIAAKEVSELLPASLRPQWKMFKSAVEAGYAMFLRMSGEQDKAELRFLVKGFQDYFAASFAASEVANKGVTDLPPLMELITDSWWSQLLEMLAEDNWAPFYIKIIEARLESFESTDGDTFLHHAARVNHRPVFQLLKGFQENYRNALWAQNKDKRTPLHVAAEKGNTRLCMLMIENKAPIDLEDSNERQAMHVAMQHGNFQCAKFLLDKWIEQHAGSRAQLKPQPNHKRHPIHKLASSILGLDNANVPKEEEFKQSVETSFIELRYFQKNEKVDRLRAMGGLLAVYWIATNHYDGFVRGQAIETRLTKSSWEWLQEWTQRHVGLTKSVNTTMAMLVFMAIMNLGKIVPFRKAFAPDVDGALEALATILQKYPILVPSYSKLAASQQQMILNALKADFNFGQFLQAEDFPASWLKIKGIIGNKDGQTSGDNVLGFMIFRNFAAMCGLFAVRGLEGSLFMTDFQYSNFKLGLDALPHFNDESPQEVLNRFLGDRAKRLGLPFDGNHDKEARAKVRLACMTRAFEVPDGKKVADAFDKLTPEERRSLMSFLNADGIVEKPGFLLFNLPNFLEAAKKSTKIGLEHATKILLAVYEAAAKEYAGSDKQVITIMVDELASHAKDCTDPEVFAFTKFSISRTAGHMAASQATVHLSPWQLVTDTKLLTTLEEERDSVISNVLNGGIREGAFLKRITAKVFYEIRYFEVDKSKEILRATVCSLLVVYWTLNDQMDAFTRGQASDAKLSDQSWGKIRSICGGMSEPSKLQAVFAIMVLYSLGKIPHFQKELAPKANGHREAMANVIDESPRVLPSYWQLKESDKVLARACLTLTFDYEQFSRAETLPSDLTPVKQMLQMNPGNSEHSQRFLTLFMYSMFAIASAKLGHQSLEGSLYMTENRWKNFSMGMEALEHLQAESEQHVYDRALEKRAQILGLRFDSQDRASRALARLAALCQAVDPPVGKKLSDAFHSLDSEDQKSLTNILVADGIHRKPGFIIADTQQYLENAMTNNEVGLAPAMRILLKVCKAAAGNTDTQVTVSLGNLASFTKEFSGSVAFHDMPFELARHDRVVKVIPKLWIPVRNPAVLDSLRSSGHELAKDILKKQVSEKVFRYRVGRSFPELSYFNSKSSVQRDQTYAAMLAVFWLITGQHSAFIRSQPEEEALTRKSWAWIQEWMAESVRLSTAEALDAVLVFMAIHALGKIPEFREELAPSFDKHLHDVALAHILDTQSEVVPSFSRLSDKYQRLIVDSLRVDFQFSQFLMAENVAANLVVVKEKLKPHKDEGFAFFCFRIFVQICGKKGAQSLNGSLFMNELQFQRFRPGLDALQQLRNTEAGPAYNSFLLLQGSQALSRFASRDHQALARLCVMCADPGASDMKWGELVCDAFDELLPAERDTLSRWLTADGIQERPGYVLSGAPTFLRNAVRNPAVGLIAALRMLIKIKETCQRADSALSRNPPSKVMVNLGELGLWAKAAGPNPEEFAQATIDVRLESHSETHVFTVEVLRPDGAGATQEAVGSSGSTSRWGRLIGISILLLLELLVIAGVLSIASFPGPSEPVLKRIGMHRHHATYVLCCLAVALLLLLCCCYSCSHRCFRLFSCCNCCSSSSHVYSAARYTPLLQQSEDDLV